MQSAKGRLFHSQDAAVADHGSRQILLENIFFTAEQPLLSSKHRAAACNALCTLLDQGFVPSETELGTLPSSHDVWLRLLDLYLVRFQDPTTKSMKQVLKSLLKFLPYHSEHVLSNDHDSSTLTEKALYKALSCIRAYDDLSSVKPSMTLLDALLSKKKVLSTSVAATFSTLKATKNLPQQNSTDDLKEHIKDFVNCILRWTRHVDVSLVSGRLLASFFSTLGSAGGHLDTPSSTRLQLLWVAPLLNFAFEDDVSLETAEEYILPSLLGVDIMATAEFLQSLPFGKLSGGHVSLISESDIRLCLLIAQILENGRLGMTKGNGSEV